MATSIALRTGVGGRRQAGGDHLPLRLALIFTSVVVVLGAVAALIGVVVDDLYPDPAATRAARHGYDFVTLFALLALGLSARRARRGSVIAYLIWTGCLAYLVYIYALSLFGSALNSAFLLQVGVLAAAGFALGFAVASVDLKQLQQAEQLRRTRWWLSGLLAVLGVALGGMWAAAAVRFALTGTVPGGSVLVETEEVVRVGMTLDLLLLVPLYLVAALLLASRSPWGGALAGTAFVSGTLLQAAYIVALVFQDHAGVAGARAYDPGEPPIAAAYLIGTAVLLRGYRRMHKTT